MLNVDACDPGSADRHPMTSNGAPLWDVAENLKRDNWSAFYQLIGNPQNPRTKRFLRAVLEAH